ETTSRGEAIADESFLLLFNSGSDTVVFTLPARRFGARWKLELSTADPHAEETSVAAREEVALAPHSLLVLRRGWGRGLRPFLGCSSGLGSASRTRGGSCRICASSA